MRITLAAALLAAALIPTQASALENEDLLALVAMPLAVAAVSEVTDMPVNELVDVVTLMNDALVPPAQFIEVVRYVPVALVVEAEPAQPEFVEFVQLQFDNGLRGTALVNSIENQFQVYGVNGVDLDVTAPRIVDVDDRFIPAIVQTRIQTRIAERRAHPHGGPPGQLKKQLGVQTGAEVVHGTKPKRRDDGKAVVTRVVDDRDDRRVAASQGGGKKNKGGNGGGNGKGKGKGKG